MNELRQEIARLSDQLHVKLDRLIDNKLKTAIEVDIVLGKLSLLYDKIENYRQSLPRQTQEEEEIETQVEQSGVTEHDRVELPEKQGGILPPPLAPEPPPVKTPYEVEKITPSPPPSNEVASAPDPEISATLRETMPAEEELAYTPPLPPSEPVSTQAPLPVPEPPTPPVPSPRPKPAPSTGDLFASTTLGDKLKNDTPSINDKITSTRKDFSLADSIHLKPIADLKANIGINEKFQFVNDLFEGSTNDYNEAINHLNNCQNSDEALAALLTLRIQHSWEEDDVSFELLRAYVARRYM